MSIEGEESEWKCVLLGGSGRRRRKRMGGSGRGMGASSMRASHVARGLLMKQDVVLRDRAR